MPVCRLSMGNAQKNNQPSGFFSLCVPSQSAHARVRTLAGRAPGTGVFVRIVVYKPFLSFFK